MPKMAKRKSLKKKAKDSSQTASVPKTQIKKGTDCVKILSVNINDDARAAALNSIRMEPMRVCRLCETKDGPFIDIFDAECMTAKKIDDIMPFVVAENDDLPHKICFRCSAKVEEFYEFVQKCTKTQERLRRALGKDDVSTTQVRTPTLWEEKLNESNISNDDICNALIRKAMEGIKDIPILSIKNNEKADVKKNSKKEKVIQSSTYRSMERKKEDKVRHKEINLNIKEELPEENKDVIDLDDTDKEPDVKITAHEVVTKKDDRIKGMPAKTTTLSIENDPAENTSNKFNIMDHISMIKVNGVGILFQCKLCNRNFLKKEVVVSHACAKNGGKKIGEKAKQTTSDTPRIPTVKYINTKTSDFSKNHVVNNSPINVDDDDDEDDKPLVQKKTKPRIGPASKVKRLENKSPQTSVSSDDGITASTSQQHVPGSLVMSQGTMPVPDVNSRYKLVPGPNNTFILVEDKKSEIDNETGSIQPTQNQEDVTRHSVPSPAGTSSEEPYPVGLIKKVTRNSNYPNLPETFTTPAMKKQSYTVVQTGNPSKLLISTKPMQVEETSRKKRKISPAQEQQQKPYSGTEEVGNRANNPGYFTFVNVDPLLQPSYVLPTDNIIQESQISTSSTVKPANDKDENNYSCNMCGEKFTLENKLIAHIQSHYNQMDKEDELRAQKNPKKKLPRNRCR